MTDRVLLGEKGSDYGLWVSKPNGDVTSVEDKDMLFSTTSASVSQILFFQTFSVPAAPNIGTPGVTTVEYKNYGGVKTYMEWWTNLSFTSANSSSYTSEKGVSGGIVLTVINEKISSTANRITIENLLNASKVVIIAVWKEAAA